jgi:uncharacterized membrane protein YccC
MLKNRYPFIKVPARVLSEVRELLAGLRDDVTRIDIGGPRAILAMKAVVSVALAVFAAHRLGLHDCWWAAISAFVVMQTGFGASLYRGLLRAIGTAIGGTLGLALGPTIADMPVVFILLMGTATWAGLYTALCSRHSYAWVLGVVTFVMVMAEASSGRGALEHFTLDRFEGVIIGTLACVIVAALADPRLHAWLRGLANPSNATTRSVPDPTPSPAAVDRREAAWHALSGAIAVMCLSAFGDLVQRASFSQAMVTSIALLIVPMASGADDIAARVLQRMTHRFMGCLIAGAVAFALLPLIQTQTLLCHLVLALGVWLGAYLQSGPASVRYMGTQFTVAFIMVFVQDQGWTVDIMPAFERLAGVFVGILVVGLVLYGITRIRHASIKPVAPSS